MPSLWNSSTFSSRITLTSTTCFSKTSSPSRLTWNRKVRTWYFYLISHQRWNVSSECSVQNFQPNVSRGMAALFLFHDEWPAPCLLSAYTQSEVRMLMSEFPWNGLLWQKWACPRLLVLGHTASLCLATLHTCLLSIQRTARWFWPLIWGTRAVFQNLVCCLPRQHFNWIWQSYNWFKWTIFLWHPNKSRHAHYTDIRKIIEFSVRRHKSCFELVSMPHLCIVFSCTTDQKRNPCLLSY